MNEMMATTLTPRSRSSSRGSEAATASASAIEDLLRVVVPALTGSRKITP
jgi:hypothetical protein